MSGSPSETGAAPVGVLHQTARLLLLLGLIGLIGLAGLTLVDVLGRWLFNAPLRGIGDIAEVALPVAIGASVPAVIVTRGNITIRFLDRLLGARAIAALDVAAGVVVLIVLAGMAYALGRHALALMWSGESTWLLRLPQWPSWTVFAGFFLVAALFQVVILGDALRRLTGRGEGAADGA
ncbi:TRAP transporter small permease (plasmid) [Tistrella bauzanensis]|uniref:TRAP transporter small permease n=1 Tax=Tistrella TaxID=171436 RepID=UPI0031F67851